MEFVHKQGLGPQAPGEGGVVKTGYRKFPVTG